MFSKKFFLAAMLFLTAGYSAQAVTTEGQAMDYKPFPHMFVNLQGGMQTTLTNYSQADLITGTASVSFGAMFTRAIGTRLHVNGAWNKGGVSTPERDFRYDYNYITTDVDLMLNILGFIPSMKQSPLGVFLIGGIGLNTAWNNDDASAINYTVGNTLLNGTWDGTRLSHNLRVGCMLEYSINRLISINAEVDANSLSDRYNSKLSDCDDWQITAQVGVAFKFGYKKKPVVLPPPEIWETRIDTTWYEEPEYRDRYENGVAVWNVFYNIRESDFEGQIGVSAEDQLKAIGTFLKDHKECRISVKSYADKGTGTPKLNLKYSKLRNEKAVAALKAAGVDPAIIEETGFYGDTEQPFAENDKNRVTIIRATGLQDVKDTIMVKKFKTEEVRYRVQ